MSEQPTYAPRNDQMTIAFTGRVGPIRENDYTDAGKTPRLRLSVANARTAGKGDELREVTTWIDVLIFGNQATGLYKKIGPEGLKGSQVAVKGRLQDGQTQRVKTVGNGEREFNNTRKEVVADMVGGFVLLGAPSGNGNTTPSAQAAEQTEDVPF